MPLSTGIVLENRYRIVRLLGQGGFGAVYRAWDTHLNRPLALKENLETSPEAQRQFKREAQILFDLSHPNLPKMFDCFTIPGQGQYLVMEFVQGEDLLEMQRHIGGPLPEAQVLGWAGQVCEALGYLHSLHPPIIHRDVKPANIKITPDGQAKLVDFGIAKVFDPQTNTTIGARAVTPGFSPPEQYGQGATDARTDIYALGATLYKLLTGQDPLESIERSLGKPLPAPRSLNPGLSLQTELAILMAMELRPQNRFASVLDLRAALLGPASHPPAPAPSPAPPLVARSTSVVAPVTATQVVETPAPPYPAPPYPAPSKPVSRPPSAPVPSITSTPASRPLPARSSPLWPGLVGALVVLLLCGVIGLGYWLGNRLAAPTSAPALAVPLATAVLPTRPVVNEPVATKPLAVANPPASPQEIPSSPTPPPPTAVPPTRKPPTKPPSVSQVKAPTKVPAGPPHLRLDKNYFCRGGPGTSYDQIWSFAAGATLEIIGQSNTGWWLIQFQDNRTSHDKCWINGGEVQGDASEVPYSDYVTIK